jgi:DNA-binding GntR family transcriptional regulator
MPALHLCSFAREGAGPVCERGGRAFAHRPGPSIDPPNSAYYILFHEGRVILARAVRFDRQHQLRDDVATFVRELIMSGEARPAAKISIEQTAQRLGVSATPVREAFLMLAEMGWLRHAAFRGFFIAPRSRADLVDAYNIHAALGGELAARCASSLVAAELANLELLDEAMTAAAAFGNPDAERHGRAFHDALYEAGRSPRLRLHIELARDVVPRRFWPQIDGWFEMELTGHAAILAALRERDAATARSEMAAHIERARDLLLAHLDALDFWTAT